MIVGVGALVALRRPWIGVMLWTWVSIMNPHRYTYGFAYEAPVAAIAAISTFVGLLATRDQRVSPLKSGAVVALLIFMACMTLSWLVGLDVGGDYQQWNKVMKIDMMVIVGMALLHSKKHVLALAWVSAGSLTPSSIKDPADTQASASTCFLVCSRAMPTMTIMSIFITLFHCW